MHRYILAAVVVAMLVPAVESASTAIPTIDTFRDGYVVDAGGYFAGWTDRIRSDSATPGVPIAYQGGVDCVRSDVSGSSFFLRTAASGCSPYARALTVDLSEPVSLAAGVDCSTGSFLVADAYGDPGELDVCQSNLVADARVIADSLFAKNSANGTAVTLVLNLQPDFRHNEFELDFEQNLPITVLSPTARTLTASTLSIADLYRISGTRKALLGRYRMPFQLTVQK